jgi:hypothetical protein
MEISPPFMTGWPAAEREFQVMVKRQVVKASVLAFLSIAWGARADDVRYYAENGITYQETRQTVRERVPETRYEERQQVVYRQQLSTQLQTRVRSFWTPVTEYRWEAYWEGWWNPLTGPHLVYHYVPRTFWQQRTETVKVPTAVRRLVPETRTIRVPVVGWRAVDREVTRRVAVRGAIGPSPPPGSAALSPPQEIGGIARLDSPVRHGVASGRRASTPTMRR